jgi:hypothetical protein
VHPVASFTVTKEDTVTTSAAQEFIKKYPNARSFIKPSHLEELSPLLEVQIEAVVVRKDEFHNLAGSYAPKKETLDKFAQAAGINFNTTAETTRKEGDGCYVGTAQGMVLGPDGKWQMGPVCEYEFDVDVRLEESKLNGKADWENKIGNKPGRREMSLNEIALERIQFQKVGRQRANTGARSRATLSLLGMQTGFKDLFSKDDQDGATRTFLFSRIIVNAKNEMVAQHMLNQITGNTAALFGPPAGSQTKAIAHAQPDAEPRRVGPGSEDDFSPAADADPDPKLVYVATVQDYLAKYEKNLGPGSGAVLKMHDMVKNPDGYTTEEISEMLGKAKGVLVNLGVLKEAS